MNLDGSILSVILSAGLLDSLNPCAIAVLLIFIALMFTLSKSRRDIFIMGLTYIGAVFLTYLAIGLGILKVLHLFNVPHLVAIASGWAVLAIGLWGIKEVLRPGKFRLLSISLKFRQKIAFWAQKATLPAAAMMGVLVGLTEFPCTGAIYVAVLGLLAAKTTFLKGLGYLILYNLMFILPLAVILIVSGNRLVVEKIINFNEAKSNQTKLISAIIMIILGAAILFWFR